MRPRQAAPEPLPGEPGLSGADPGRAAAAVCSLGPGAMSGRNDLFVLLGAVVVLAVAFFAGANWARAPLKVELAELKQQHAESLRLSALAAAKTVDDARR